MSLRSVLLSTAMLVLLDAGMTAAQDAPGGDVAILTMDPDRLFAESAFGRQTLLMVEGDAQSLQAENRRIEADLEVEERSLTDRRGTMAPEAFRAAADAFDAKVQGIRAAQTAKARELAQQRDMARQQFLQATAPVLAAIMADRGAVAIIDRSAIILSFDRVDITDLAISRVDAVLAGTLTGPAPHGDATPGLESGPAEPDLVSPDAPSTDAGQPGGDDGAGGAIVPAP